MAEHATSTPAPATLPVGFPLPIIAPHERRRLEAVVDRLGAYHDRFARHARRAAAAIERIERLRQSAISALDRVDGDADLEAGGCDEPSLAFQETRSFDSQDAAIQWSPTGGPAYVDLEEGDDDEPSLCGVSFGPGNPRDLEDACEDEGAVTGDDEPEVDL